MTTTITDDPPAHGARPGRLHARLTFLGTAEDASSRSSSHALDQLDEVRFLRGTRATERRGRTLTLTLPDGRMSREHGRLIRHGARWVLEDPASKNGAIIDEAVQRKAVLVDGTAFALGRSFFLFGVSVVSEVPAHLDGDADAAGLLPAAPGLATFSPALAVTFARLAQAAESAMPILLLGETGTGKEVTARAIHALSRRRGELVAVSCAALADSLLEGELFGHQRGAFTGAAAERRGLVRTAAGGTLFLDEIGELPPPAQASLLRVLQEREVLPLGADRPVAVDLRVIAATLRDLVADGAGGRFRPDLYARLAGHVAVLPPLRERRADLGLLTARLLERLAPGRAIELTAPAWGALVRHGWPRNVRELEMALTSAITFAPRGVVDVEHLPEEIRRPTVSPPAAPAAAAPPDAENHADDHALREQVMVVLAEHGGNVGAAAKALGRQRTQLYRWIDRFGIDLEQLRRR